ncbi:FHA domain-containing protein [Kineosporiaceae bacterium SCSIO 59966]|jgi:pSer/pThr/pTyr-binding forkhead associated (FHA) protein|nr:FHA domain-containing protein [Kineosporiaceae bacterium SCSIO 59966]
MSELTLTVLQLGFVVLLWVFVLAVVAVLRRDLYGGTTVARRSPSPRSPSRRPQPAAPAASRPAGPPPSSPAATTNPRTLVVTAGSLAGTTLTLGSSPVLIGRAPECTLVLTDEYASGRHARLFPRDGRWWVEDLGSTNGTRLGRSPVTAPTPVEPGQQLRIGRTVLELRR